MIGYCVTNMHAFFCFDRSYLTRVRNMIVEGVMPNKVEYKAMILIPSSSRENYTNDPQRDVSLYGKECSLYETETMETGIQM